jgi:hypothetical protein
MLFFLHVVIKVKINEIKLSRANSTVTAVNTDLPNTRFISSLDKTSLNKIRFASTKSSNLVVNLLIQNLKELGLPFTQNIYTNMCDTLESL